MKLYLVSLAVGLLVGVIYSLLTVRSPAPPLVALIGLLGMLVGEQIIPAGKQLLSGTALTSTSEKSQDMTPVPGKLASQQSAPVPSQSKDESR
ncbi:XapX domain-containing protein [Phyllobacterium sp. YR531]|uniref:XapX domain-containing protein n=1 Tax=Phyllobacterium sp. YR531 TaxID=1144343 RepID=UPI00026FC44D|nr:XapX domain-containing protein [Phyllobacterium sp. YR531]EJM97850.1 hypothetical protein PMI41_04981 [Phyllobacterium sp. YR531]